MSARDIFSLLRWGKVVSYRKAVAVAVTCDISHDFGYARMGSVMAFRIVACVLYFRRAGGCSVGQEGSGKAGGQSIPRTAPNPKSGVPLSSRE